MTIKKPMKTEGGATIASRLRLDTPDSTTAKATSSKSIVAAFTAGLIALAAVGALAYLLWKHWEFLMPA